MRTDKTGAGGAADKKSRVRRLGLPVALVVILVAVVGTWVGLTLADHSIEKPNRDSSEQGTRNPRDFDYQGAGALDPDSEEWAEKYGQDHPEAVTPGTISSDAATGACTLSVSCHTAVEKGMAAQERWRGIVPPSGVILARTVVEFREGETAFDILQRVLREQDIQLEFNGLLGVQYVEGINNLFEFDGGPDSGWMYSVNDWYPNYGAGQYLVQSGDVIEWDYTCDLGRDLGQDWILK